MQTFICCTIQPVNTSPLSPSSSILPSTWKRRASELALTVRLSWHAHWPTVAQKLGFMEHFYKSVKLSIFSRQGFAEANGKTQFTM